MQHVRGEYQAALPALQALLAAFPEHIKPEQVSEERFLWACSLWYSYAMEASLPQRTGSACTAMYAPPCIDLHECRPLPWADTQDCFLVQVQLTDGSLQQCLVPVATMMNHSATAHIVRYGRVDAGTGLLCFRAFRCAS